MKNLHAFTITHTDGKEGQLSDSVGKALLVVNVPSKCGFTHQYKGLQSLSEHYRERGLEIRGFPSNSFARQEPGSDAEVKDFCTRTLGVTFPMSAWISVGEGHPPPLRIPHGQEDEPQVRGKDTVGLHQVPSWPGGKGRRPIRPER
jgi:glutathione peroxidase